MNFHNTLGYVKSSVSVWLVINALTNPFLVVTSVKYAFAHIPIKFSDVIEIGGTFVNTFLLMTYHKNAFVASRLSLVALDLALIALICE